MIIDVKAKNKPFQRTCLSGWKFRRGLTALVIACLLICPPLSASAESAPETPMPTAAGEPGVVDLTPPELPPMESGLDIADVASLELAPLSSEPGIVDPAPEPSKPAIVEPEPSKPAIVEPTPEPPPEPELPAIVKVKVPARAKAALVVNAYTGEVFSSKNADKALPVASTSKIMTVWLVMKKIESGRSLSEAVKIKSKKIENMSRKKLYGGYVLKKGQSFTVRQLLYLTVVKSSNAAAVQLGIWVAGSNAKFVKLMNKEAKSLGLTKSSFTSACGLDNYDMGRLGLKVTGNKKATNMMSARDLARLSQKLIAEYPQALNYSKTVSIKIKVKKITTTNKILKDKKLIKKAKTLNIDGLKTGSTKSAGYCLVATGQAKGKHRLISVILDDDYRSADTVDLLLKVYKSNPVRLTAQ